MLIHETIAGLRLLEDDHEPDGWPAVRMREITQVLDWLESVTADRDERAAQKGELMDHISRLMEEIAELRQKLDDFEEAGDLDDEEEEINLPSADGSVFVSQMELICAIWKHLAAKHGKTLALCSRHNNAIIDAANEIVRALRTPVILTHENMGLTAWLASDDTGLSSKYLASVLSDRGLVVVNNYPRDPGDFGRCVRLLDAVPELRAKLPRLSYVKHGRVWNAIYANWEELERFYREEYSSGSAPKNYERMQEIIKESRTKS